jgi:hypothetical protein
MRVLEVRCSELELLLAQEKASTCDLRDNLNQEKSNNVRLLQQLRALRIEAKKKDKIITKKNFQIGSLVEKVEVLQRSNATLFKELD